MANIEVSYVKAQSLGLLFYRKRKLLGKNISYFSIFLAKFHPSDAISYRVNCMKGKTYNLLETYFFYRKVY